MLKHKSFVIKNGKPKAKVMSMTTRERNVLRPEIAINNDEEQDSGHYDNNEQILIAQF